MKIRNSKFEIRNSFTLMELMLTIALAALIISIAVPTFVGINRGASAKQADNLVYATLKQAQQAAFNNRQKVAFGVVTTVLSTNNRWVSANMANRGYFLFASDSSTIDRPDVFLTQIQMLPAPMMFEFTSPNSSTIPTRTMKDTNGVSLFDYRSLRFAPAGGVFWPDADASNTRIFEIVVTEGLAGAGGTLTPKTSGSIIKYTNLVNVFTGKVSKP